MAVNDISLIGIVGSLNGQVVMNTFGLRTSTDIAGPSNETAVAFVQGAIASAWCTGRSVDYKLVNIIGRDIVPGTAPMFVAAQGSIPGTINEGAAPPNCAVVTQWRTLLKGRANRGRIFQCGWPVSGAVGGYWTADVQNAASAASSLIFDAFGPNSGASFELGIISYNPGSHPRTVRAFVPIIAFSIDNVIRSMRTREVGKGI